MVSCGHLLPTARMQRPPWCGVFGWLPTALALHVGEHMWHSSRQGIPSSLCVPPCPSGTSQASCLMCGPVFSNAQKCQKDRLVLALPVCSLQPLLPMTLLAGRWQDGRQRARVLGSLNSFKGAFEILLCAGPWAVLAANWDFASIPALPWSGIGAAGQGLFCLLEKREAAECSGCGGMLETAGKAPNPNFFVFLTLGLTELAVPTMP